MRCDPLVGSERRRSSLLVGALLKIGLALAGALLTVGLALAGGALAIGCGGRAPQAKETAPAGPVEIGAENVAVVQRETIRTGPRIAGSLQAKRQAMVRAEAGGSVKEVRVELGETVKEGQLLARIEAKALRDALASARSGVTSAELDLQLANKQADRIERLVKGGALSDRDLELARNSAAASASRAIDARARLAAARKQLEATTVTSPISGAVSNRAVNTGDVVSPGSPLFTVIDPSSMRLEASVASDQLASLAIGAPVRFQVRGYPGQTFEGKVERISPGADPVTRQIPILVSIPNPGGKLIAGLFADGRVATEQREALVIPLSAVDIHGSSPGSSSASGAGASATVHRVKEGVVEEVPVKTGIRDEQTEKIEVTGALEVGDRLLMGAARGMAAGSKVALKATASPAAPGASATPAAAAAH